MKPLYTTILAVAAMLSVGLASAKLPPPSDEAKAKAAEAAAKSAHGNKVAAYQLCKSQDKVAAEYFAGAKKTGTTVTPPLPTPACQDPGPFAYTPAVAATPAPMATAAAPAPAPKQ